MMTADIIRYLLLVDIIAMAVFALIFLRQRRMNWFAYLGWGLIAVAVPILGPFLVISKRPGAWDPSYSLKSDLVRLAQFFRRVLPEPVNSSTPSRGNRSQRRPRRIR